MKLVSWNVNGIRAVHRKEQLVPMVETLKPDVLCLQETKARSEQSEVDLPEYEEYWNSAERKGYSGTAVFSKIKPLSIIEDFPEAIVKKYGLKDGFGDTNAEGRVLVLEFSDFYILTVYTPNAKRDLGRLPLRDKHWDPAFLAYMKLLEEKKSVIACGDFNVAHKEIDIARPKENKNSAGFTKEERTGFDNYIMAGFIDTFRMFHNEGECYTWWSNFNHARERNIGWRIDYFLVSSALKEKVKKANVHMDIFGSDHCPISVEIES